MPTMPWADSDISKVLADNLAAFGRQRGMANWNQMADQFKEWSKDKAFVDPMLSVTCSRQ